MGGEGAILDPYSGDQRLEDLIARVASLEQRPQFTPPLYYQAAPYQSSVPPDANWYTGHTNGFLTDSQGTPWVMPIPRVAKPAAYCRIAWITPAATTGEIRVTSGSVGATTTSTVVLPAGSSGVQTFLWLHNVRLWQNQVIFDVQARRASGAGTVLVQAPVFALVDTNSATLTGL